MIRIGADSARSSLSSGAAEVPGLRIGASLIIKALEPAAEGRWTVLVNGVKLEASVSATLSPGIRYAARADRLPDRPGWVFRILGNAEGAREADLLGSSGLPGDPSAVLALHALMAETLPLDPKSIARLRAALLHREDDGERADLLARALAKGLDPESLAEAVEGVGARSDSDGGRGRRSGPDGGGPGNDGGRPEGEEAGDSDSETPSPTGPASRDGFGSAGSAGADAGMGIEAPPYESAFAQPAWKEFQPSGAGEEIRKEGEGLAGLLPFLATRSDDNPNPYQLFNARTGPRGRWIYAPYRFEREGVAFSGTLRILVNEGSCASGLVSADVLAESDEGGRGSYAFVVRPYGQGVRLSLSSRDPSDARRLAGGLPDLTSDLAALGCSVELVSEDSLSESTYRPVDDHA